MFELDWAILQPMLAYYGAFDLSRVRNSRLKLLYFRDAIHGGLISHRVPNASTIHPSVGRSVGYFFVGCHVTRKSDIEKSSGRKSKCFCPSSAGSRTADGRWLGRWTQRLQIRVNPLSRFGAQLRRLRLVPGSYTVGPCRSHRRPSHKHA